MKSDFLSRYWPALLLVLLGGALRFYGLGTESLWLDEALSWQQANLQLPDLLASIAADVHPPLYALLLHAFVSMLGDSETSLRLLSAIAGTACIWLTWEIGRLIAGARVAWIAALLLTLSVFAIQYAQEARMYALLCCLALASLLTFIRLTYAPVAARGGNDTRSLPAQLPYLLTTALLMYSHVYGLFIVIAQNFIVLVRYTPFWPHRPLLPLRQWLLLQAVLGAAFLPWIWVLAAQVARVQTSFWIDPPTVSDLVETFKQYMGVMPALLLGAVAALGGILALMWPAARWPLSAQTDITLPRADAALLLLTWLLLPVALPYMLSLVVQPIYMPRYTIASSPAWFLLIALGISAIRQRWLRTGALGVLVLVMAAVLPVYYTNSGKTPWPAVVALVEEQANPGDLVLFHNPDVLVPWKYYQQRDDLDLRTVVAADTWQAAGVTDARKPDVRPVARNFKQVWLVSGYDVKTAITEIEIVRQLASVLKPLDGREFDAIRVFRFVDPGNAQSPQPARTPAD